MITQVHLTNFKSFRKTTVRLGSLTLIVGANAAGKSNFFDALRFLQYVGAGASVRDALEGHISSVPSGAAIAGIRGGRAESVNFGAEDGSRVFEIGVDIKFNGSTIKYRIGIDADNYRVVTEQLGSTSHPGDYVYSTDPDTGTLVHDPESPSIAARVHRNTRGVNPKFQFSPYETLLSQFTGRRTGSNQNEEVAELARAELRAIRPLELRPEILREYSRLGDFIIGEHGENLGAAAWYLNFMTERRNPPDEESEQRVKIITSWLSELTPHTITSFRALESPTEDVVFALKEDGYDEPITARSLSDGTLRFAAFAFIVFGTGGKRTLAIEELENGINPARLELLIRMFEGAVEKEDDLQVIATTHSPTVLNWISESTRNAVIVIGWNERENCSRAVKLSDLPGLDDALEAGTLGELQSEGWIQMAADTS